MENATADLTAAQTLTGREALEYAEQHGLPLCKFADPVEDARSDLSVEEARAVLAEDPSLVWVSVEPRLEAERRARTQAGVDALAANTAAALGREK